jgi:basic amino acid/polyamine antiporter, APA family
VRDEPNRLLARKSVAELQHDAANRGLKRALGPVHVMLLGIGFIVGAGIYVMPGAAAANYAGPAVIISFIIAALACGLTGLCYAELASTLPVSGSSYSYCYAALGEVFAWIIGWLLILEYTVATALLGVGFAGYFTSFMASLGVVVPPSISTSLVQPVGIGSSADFVATGGINLVAGCAILAVVGILTLGISQSAYANSIMVTVKILVLAVFVAVGVGAIDPVNWTPFIPVNEGGFAYGWPGIVRAASMLFFAYLGYETVAAAAAEAKHPQRDMPIGILGALLICTVLYIVVAAVLTGIVPYRELGVADPIAVAIDRIDRPQLALLIKLGALAGLASVMLGTAYGLSRTSFAMACDGLLPPLFAKVHPRLRTPHIATLLFGSVAAIGAAFLPLSMLGTLISFGTAMAFSIVCLSVIWLRNTRPDLERPFRVPFGGVRIRGVWIGFVPAAAMLMCWLMVVPAGMDIARQAATGDIIPAAILAIYAIVGAAVYVGYGLRRPRSPVPAQPL